MINIYLYYYLSFYFDFIILKQVRFTTKIEIDFYLKTTKKLKNIRVNFINYLCAHMICSKKYINKLKIVKRNQISISILK